MVSFNKVDFVTCRPRREGFRTLRCTVDSESIDKYEGNLEFHSFDGTNSDYRWEAMAFATSDAKIRSRTTMMNKALVRGARCNPRVVTIMPWIARKNA